MSDHGRRVLLPGERFMRKNCQRCHRRLDIDYQKASCKQCCDIATMIVESCAMNLALMPSEALQDADCGDEVMAAVAAARAAFHASGITPAIIEQLRTKITSDVEDGLIELDEAAKKGRIIQ